MKKAVVFLAEGAEELEAVTIIDILRRGNVEVSAMSLDSELVIPCSRGVTLLADSGWDNDIIAEADMLVAPGGMSGMKLMLANPRVCKAFFNAAENGRIVAAICAAPVMLAKAGVLKDRRATCYPGMEDSIAEGGAKPQKNDVVIDGNIITGNGPGSSVKFALELVRILYNDITAKKVADGLLV